MAALLTNQTSDGVGSGVSVTDECWVEVPNDSVFDGAKVHFEVSSEDTAGKYQPVGYKHVFTSPRQMRIDGLGTYFVRARVSRSGPSTNISANVLQ